MRRFRVYFAEMNELFNIKYLASDFVKKQGYIHFWPKIP